MSMLGIIWTKNKRGCPAGTGGHPEFGTLSIVRSQALVCWSIAISKSNFTKKSGWTPLKEKGLFLNLSAVGYQLVESTNQIVDSISRVKTNHRHFPIILHSFCKRKYCFCTIKIWQVSISKILLWTLIVAIQIKALIIDYKRFYLNRL